MLCNFVFKHSYPFRSNGMADGNNSGNLILSAAFFIVEPDDFLEVLLLFLCV